MFAGARDFQTFLLRVNRVVAFLFKFLVSVLMLLGRLPRVSLRIVQRRGLSVFPALALRSRIQRTPQPPCPLTCRTFATPPPLLNAR